MTNRMVNPEDAEISYTAAIVSAPHLALQLERLGISDPAESLEDAEFVRRDLLATVEKLRGDVAPG